MRGEGAVLSARAPHNERLSSLWPGWHTKSTHPGSVEGERGGVERARRAGREREKVEMETTGDPKESGKGEGEAEALTRDEGGREGLNTGMRADSLNEWRGGWRTEEEEEKGGGDGE